MKRSTLAAAILALTLVSACKKPVPPPMYEPVSVIRKDITVSAEAAGAVILEPETGILLHNRGSFFSLENFNVASVHVGLNLSPQRRPRPASA